MMKFKLLLLFICDAISLYGINADDPTLVTLPEGQIRGRSLKSPDDNVYYAFQEIPYAVPPVGKLRFKAPVAAEKWKGVLNTTENTKICYQGGSHRDVRATKQTEDCLYLNVYTPVPPGSANETLPVLIWIHGGSFLTGAGILQDYNPEWFIDHKVIVVTINYRLGALGFLTTEDGVIPGNLGLRDQHFAIQWVKNHIKLFGGDPEKITISGESAGATSVGFQLISKRNKGLFRGAILQSSATLSQRLHQDYARFYAFELGKSLDPNFTSNDSKQLLELLQKASAAEISVNKIFPAPGKERSLVEGDGLIWLPVIEDENLDEAFITGLLHENVRTGNINRSICISDASIPEKRAKYFDGDLSNLIRNKYNMTKENKLTAGRKLRGVYTDGTFEDELGAVVKFFSDESFTTPIIRHAKLQSNYSDVYLYQFSYKGKLGGQMGVEVAGVKGVGHAEDVAYLWGKRTDEKEDDRTRHRLLTMWSNFVKYLNPTPEEDDFLDNAIWKKVAPNDLVYLNIDSTLDMRENPRKYIEWEKIVDVYAIPPLENY
ncbi:hypothetical protein NQ315_001950 [Exocentrus adspersus]|uniref:Carboxylic ester hydrolase n=1 Tax=Exocentrus adspersus TaxID=1586481 RepID=A0AAV8WB30_9CUCU|nr:hypothetical protein NQ315_001950 [Exocentrus adspersus]